MIERQLLSTVFMTLNILIYILFTIFKHNLTASQKITLLITMIVLFMGQTIVVFGG